MKEQATTLQRTIYLWRYGSRNDIEIEKECPKVIIDFPSVPHGTVGISVYDFVGYKEYFERRGLLAEQLFSIRRTSARSVEEIDPNTNSYFRTQRKIADSELQRQELADLYEKLI